MRAGAQALSLLAVPLNLRLLEALADGPRALIDLRRGVGSPPQSTMRIHLRRLAEVEAVDRVPGEEHGNSPVYELTPPGRALLDVAQALRDWLEISPPGPVALGSETAKSMTRALIDAWSANIVRALAAKPLSLTELDRVIPKLTYPALERRLTALRLTDLVEGQRGEGRKTPYMATPWLRHSVGPITAAMAWERRYIPELTSPIGRLDVEAVFLLAMPLMQVDESVSGRCRLAVEVQRASTPVFAGIIVCLEKGILTSCVTELEGEAEAWVSGPPFSWLRWMSGEDGKELEIGGDAVLAEEITEALRSTTSKPR